MYKRQGFEGVDLTHKEQFRWLSVIRLPDFVTRKDFEWAVQVASKKKKIDCSKVEMLAIHEGLCVQIMHIGTYDDESRNVAQMSEWMAQNGYRADFSATRLHHEIYLSDPRKTPPEKLRTIIRHPICKK